MLLIIFGQTFEYLLIFNIVELFHHFLVCDCNFMWICENDVPVLIICFQLNNKILWIKYHLYLFVKLVCFKYSFCGCLCHMKPIMYIWSLILCLFHHYISSFRSPVCLNFILKASVNDLNLNSLIWRRRWALMDFMFSIRFFYSLICLVEMLFSCFLF